MDAEHPHDVNGVPAKDPNKGTSNTEHDASGNTKRTIPSNGPKMKHTHDVVGNKS